MTQGKCSNQEKEAERRRKIAEYSKTRTYSPETCKKIKDSKIGDKNPAWKGDDVGYRQLHTWIVEHIPKPDVCPNCGLNKKLDAHNVTGKYLRDESDWIFLCRKCHDNVDHTLLKNVNRIEESDVISHGI